MMSVMDLPIFDLLMNDLLPSVFENMSNLHCIEGQVKSFNVSLLCFFLLFCFFFQKSISSLIVNIFDVF